MSGSNVRINSQHSNPDRVRSRAPDLRTGRPDRHGDRSRRNLPIIGIDGEGGGPLGIQEPYLLMRAATEDGRSWELFKDNKPLMTTDCLEFILSLPHDYLIFGFSFGYDVTQIVKSEMSHERLRFLFGMKEPKKAVADGQARQEQQAASIVEQLSSFTLDCEGMQHAANLDNSRVLFDRRVFDGAAIYDWGIEDQYDVEMFHTLRNQQSLKAWTYWRGYALKYLPGRRLSVARAEVKVNAEGKHEDVVIAGSKREIYDCFGFFQTSFVETLETFAVTEPDVLARIKANKDRRSSFMGVDDETRGYCHLECTELAKLMTNFRGMLLANEAAYASATGRMLRLWAKDPWGAGSIAEAILKSTHCPVRPRLDRNSKPAKNTLVRPLRPRALENMAVLAYFGGRFETSATGRIARPVYEYDINSAYPFTMQKLPCPMCTEWKWSDTRPKGRGKLYLGLIDFSHPLAHRKRWCGFPWRLDSGTIVFPANGRGCYWSCEIEAAEDILGAKVKWLGGFVAERVCKHDYFDFVPEIYDFRAALEKEQKGSGIGFKLGLNSIYGKECQSVGSAGFRDMIAAGLITARTRLKLVRAMGYHPEDVLMLATDAIYSTRKLRLPTSGVKVLGEWECSTYDRGMFIIMAGVFKMYPGPDQDAKKLSKTKRRGIGAKALEKAMSKIIDAWATSKDAIIDRGAAGAPKVWSSNPNFRSARHALSMETSADREGLLSSAGVWQHECDDPNCDHAVGTCGKRCIDFSWAHAKRAPWCDMEISPRGGDATIVAGKDDFYHVRHRPTKGEAGRMTNAPSKNSLTGC